MVEIGMLAVDWARGGFQVCGVGPDGWVVFDKAMSRLRLHALLAGQSACVVAMGAGWRARRRAAGVGWRSRTATRGAWCRRPTPSRTSKRQKGDRADAEAIAEAASRPSM